MAVPTSPHDVLVLPSDVGLQSTKTVLFASVLTILALLVRFCVEHQRCLSQESGDQQREVANYVPFFGHHFNLLSHPAETLRRWAHVYGDVFVIRLGRRRVTMINSGKAARAIYARQSNALNSRPELWTYHHVFSKGGKSTLSTTPFNQLFANAKKAAPFSQAYLSQNLRLIDLETRQFLEECLASRGQPIDPLRMLQRMLISMNINLCWGRRIMSQSDPFLLELIECEYKIMELRNMYTNFQDGIPFLRVWPLASKSREARQIRVRRDAYLRALNEELDEKMARNEGMNCLRAELLGHGDAFADETDVLCMTMLGAGVGPSAGGLHWGMALLAVRQDIQEKAYQELREYTGVEPSMHALDLDDGEGCPYILAMAEEILRAFTPTRLGLPRYTTKDISYDGQVIPRDSIVVMNGWSCNRDPAYWPTDPNIFMPERWLDPTCPQHFTFSLGARSCAGTMLAKRMSYVFYARLLSTFEVRLKEGSKFRLDALEDSTWYALLSNPQGLQVELVPRNEGALRRAMSG